MKNNQKLSTLFWLNKQKQKDNAFALYIRINIDGKKATISTGYYIKKSCWDARSKKVKNSARNYMQINAYIDRTKSEIQQHFFDAVASGKMISSQEIKNKLLGIEDKPKYKTLKDAFNYHNLKMKEKVEAELSSPATLLKYEITWNKVASFMNDNLKVDDLSLKDLKYSFVTEFEHYLLTAEGLQSNTAYKYIKNLKRIMNIAVELEWIEKNPFSQFKCSYKSPERIVLTQLEIDTLINTEIEIQRLAEVRDVFVFCCYTGFAYSEVHKLKQTDLSIGIDGEYWLSTYREKSKERESVPLLPIPFEIIKKYEEHSHCIKQQKLLPVNSNQRFNSYLKELADICGIKKHLTTHIARHTFATTVTLSNGVPIETVSRMLGHTKLATTQIYAKVLDLKVSQDMKVLKGKMRDSEKTELKKRTS